jgi:hypothetical protein
MILRGTRYAVLAGLLLPIMVGCGWSKRKPYAGDPLLRLQRPVVDSTPTQLATSTAAEPYAPPRPDLPTDPLYARLPKTAVMGVNPPSPDPISARTDTAEPPMMDSITGPELPAPPIELTATPSAPRLVSNESPAQPVNVPRPEPLPALETPQSPPQAPPQPDTKTYGHDSNYRWLRGVLDVHHRGYLALRYCDASVEDRWGGKVRFEPDDRLNAFHDGDEIFVEGELIPEGNDTETKAGYPRYRITSVRLARDVAK